MYYTLSYPELINLLTTNQPVQFPFERAYQKNFDYEEICAIDSGKDSTRLGDGELWINVALTKSLQIPGKVEIFLAYFPEFFPFVDTL